MVDERRFLTIGAYLKMGLPGHRTTVGQEGSIEIAWGTLSSTPKQLML